MSLLVGGVISVSRKLGLPAPEGCLLIDAGGHSAYQWEAAALVEPGAEVELATSQGVGMREALEPPEAI